LPALGACVISLLKTQIQSQHCNKRAVYNSENFWVLCSISLYFLQTSSPLSFPSSSLSHASTLRAQRRAAMRDGFNAVRPGLIALAIWGVVTGVAMVKAGLSEPQAIVMSLLVYAGSAQLTALPLMAAGAPIWLIFAAGIIVNLRFLIFGAALHPFFRDLSWRKRLLLGYLSVDVSFVVFMPRFADALKKGTLEQHWFFIGTILPAWIVWQTASMVGIALGAIVPVSWSLEFGAVLALMAMMLPYITSRPVLISVLASALTAWLTQLWPLRLGLLAAVIVGIIAGMWAERRSSAQRTQSKVRD
jgi:predicted branched-subunit amino acid permease